MKPSLAECPVGAGFILEIARAVSLLEELQNEAVDSHGDVASLLRKCKILAARLNSKPLEDWLVWESGGYPTNAEVPDYRLLAVRIHGTFSCGASMIQNVPIEPAFIPKDWSQQNLPNQCRQSIAALEQLLRDSSGRKPLSVSTGNLSLFLSSKVYVGYDCVHAWGEISSTEVHEIMNTVRNRVLDFALAIWKEDPSAGEQPNQVAKIDESRVNQIFNMTVHGGTANVIGTASQSTVVFNVTAGDFSTLKAALNEYGVDDEDLVELKEALDAETTRPSASTFGPRVAAWIGKMVHKAAIGSWAIAAGAAGNLLAQAIGTYYGGTG